MPRLGAHLSTAGGWHRALEAAQKLGLESLQIFLQPPGRWERPPEDPEAITLFAQMMMASKVRGAVFAHAPYLVNLAAEDPKLAQRSAALVTDLLVLGSRLGLAGVVVHPGSAGRSCKQQAVARVRKLVGEILAQVPSGAPLLLENTAGGGGLLGARVGELYALGEGFWGKAEMLGLCLDTAHLWACAYDLRHGGWEQALAELAEAGLLPRLRLVHINDTPVPLGSRRDRHAPPGEGQLGEAFFAKLLQEPSLADVPCVLEIPPGPKNGAVKEALARLRSWLPRR